MPTNKLWLEHTEQAAWQSVDALREKLAAAEQREARLAPPVEGWRELLGALDAVRAELGLSDKSYADTLRFIVARTRESEARVRMLEEEAQKSAVHLLSAPPPARPKRKRRDDTPVALDDEDEGGPVRGEHRLLREIKDRYGEFSRNPTTLDAHGVLSDVLTRLDELPGLDPGETLEAAADLGALALFLSRGTAPSG